ncbi:UNVERIFIED_CONTAM: Eukaryotic translation initiation factor 2B, subunit 4 delta, 67kDa [Siphonaria sp. JEL0065]|nr:Eukaryotic translation initiation factor 2B, subunit 4 delta, 67kDa [Siphonaria sp. JEL0065]
MTLKADPFQQKKENGPKKFKDMTPEEQREFKERGEAEKLAKKIAKEKAGGAAAAQNSQPPKHPQQQKQQPQKQQPLSKQPSAINANASSHPNTSTPTTSNTNLTAPAPLLNLPSQANMRAPSQIRFDDAKHQKKTIKGRTLAQKPVALLSHLTQFEKSGIGAARTFTADGQQRHMVHPAIITLGVQFSEFIISGGIARCTAMLHAFKKVISDYVTPPGTSIQRNLTSYLGKQIDYLTTTRHLAETMKFAIRQLKSEISNISLEKSDEDTKAHLLHWIEIFIKEKIISADESIVDKAMKLIKHDDVILTYGRSAAVERLLLEAPLTGRSFKVIVCDARPKLEGKILIQNLANAGIPCSYVLVNSLGAVMPKVTKLILGASALLSNGAVLSRTGTAIAAMMAHDAHIPVIVLCELIKFSELVQLDSFVWNEIGDPDELVTTKTQSPASVLPSVLTPPSVDTNAKAPILKEWRDIPDLKLLNLHYDITPASFISMVISEHGCIPSSSVLSVIAMVKLEEEKNLKKLSG